MQPNCKQHPERKVELICFSPECQIRLTLQCTKCLNSSKCKRHNWKMLDDFIEEIFEICETLEVKEEKKKKPAAMINSKITKSKLMIDEIIKGLSEKIDQMKFQIVRAAEDHGTAVVRSLDPPKVQSNYKLVKDVVNNFRRAEDRNIEKLNDILSTLNAIIGCDQEGVLHLQELQEKVKDKQKEELEMHDSSMAGVEDFREHTDKIIQNLQGFLQGNAGKDKFEKERKTLYSYIEDLNQQVKQLPVLKQRIEDQAMKIEAKDKKIKRFEAEIGEVSQKPAEFKNDFDRKGGQMVNKQQSNKQARIARIQKLLEVRQVVTRMAIEHCQNCNRETVKGFRLAHGEDGYALEIGDRPCEKAAMINFSIIAVADELNFLQYSEKADGPGFINVQLLAKKPVSQNKNPLFDNCSGLFGGASNNPFRFF